MACNLPLPHEDNIPSEFRILKERHIQMREYQLVGLKTRPTIVPRSGFELTTSRLHSFIVAKVSHAISHSATEAVVL